MKILVTPTSLCKNRDSELLMELKAFADEIVFSPYDHPLKEEELLPLLEGADGYIAGLDYIDAEVIKKMPASVKIISRYGTGFERVDIKAAGEKGIIVTNTPGVNSQSVADLAIGLLISVARKIPYLDTQVKSGQWPRTSGVELFGKKMGILGLGAIGKNVAARAKGFSMEVLAYDPYFDAEYAKKEGIRQCTLDEVLEGADFISLHLPLMDSTKNIINEAAIAKMKPGAIVINTSRGGLIDEAAMYDALKSGKIGGLGLDAFEKEPPEPSPMFGLDNVVTTPHAGAHTKEAVENMARLSVRNLIDVLSGKECRNIVNSKFMK